MTTIKVKNKKELEKKILEFRNDGWFIVTFGTKRVEMEKGNTMIIIEV